MAPAPPSLKPKTLTPSLTSPSPSTPRIQSIIEPCHSHLESLLGIYSVLSFPPAQPWLRILSGLSGHLPSSPSSVPSQGRSIFCLKKSHIWNARPWFSTQPTLSHLSDLKVNTTSYEECLPTRPWVGCLPLEDNSLDGCNHLKPESHEDKCSGLFTTIFSQPSLVPII